MVMRYEYFTCYIILLPYSLLVKNYSFPKSNLSYITASQKIACFKNNALFPTLRTYNMYVCMYVCTYSCIYVCMYVRIILRVCSAIYIADRSL